MKESGMYPSWSVVTVAACGTPMGLGLPSSAAAELVVGLSSQNQVLLTLNLPLQW